MRPREGDALDFGRFMRGAFTGSRGATSDREGDMFVSAMALGGDGDASTGDGLGLGLYLHCTWCLCSLRYAWCMPYRKTLPSPVCLVYALSKDFALSGLPVGVYERRHNTAFAEIE